MRSFLLAIDAGSSSIRCTAYEYHRHHSGGGSGDNCVDETLKLLRQRMLSCDLTHSYPHQVVAIGFSTFVMNFVALDIHGDPVGEVATCSYACNRDDVVEECQRLRE